MISALVDSIWDYALGLAVLCSTALSLFLLTLPSRYDPQQRSIKEGESSTRNQNATQMPPAPEVTVQIVVLGDIGRSPRMQYHALSIAKHGGHVDLIGYNESEVHPNIKNNPRINIVAIPPSPQRFQTSNKLLFLFVAPLKILWQIWTLYQVLGYQTKAAKWMLVQNPPSIPTLAIAQYICLFRNTRLIIDWHNFGYSILALKLGKFHPLVIISRIYEVICARPAAAHLTVTNAMANVLKQSFGVNALPLHDRPPKHFQPLSREQRRSFLERLPNTAPYIDELKAGTRKLIVSSTSWTPDEDFSLLLEALVRYSKTIEPPYSKMPKILAIITGKGPQKEHYLSEIQRLSEERQLSNAVIDTAWLSMEDYASLLGAADIGISLHTSSSGVDLPMKVVDMFGTGLPVFGWSKFEAWPELVTEKVNGMGFGKAQELANLFVEFFENDTNLKRLRAGALLECKRRWDEEWDPVAGKLLGLVD